MWGNSRIPVLPTHTVYQAPSLCALHNLTMSLLLKDAEDDRFPLFAL